MDDPIEEHLKSCRATALSEVTIKDRGEVLRRLDHDLPFGLVDATTEDLQDWLARKGWLPETRKTYWVHIVGFFRERTQIGYLERDPSAGLIRPRVPEADPHPVADDELAYALTHLPRPWSVYVALAAYAGLRAAEIADLQRKDITKDWIFVRKGKGGKSRHVETNRDLWPVVEPLQQGPIALLGSGRVMTPHQLSNRMNYRLHKIGLQEVTLHRFRHWFGTTLVAKDINLLTVAELMGHSNPNTTKRYVRITSGQRRLAVNSLPALVPTSC